MSSPRAKILLVGPVNGRLRLLSDKLRTLQRGKAGPFDVCLCSGPFFHRTTVVASSTDEDTQQKERDELKEEAKRDSKDLANGLLAFDVPVLFMDIGDGLRGGLKAPSLTAMDNLKYDEDEINIDDEDESREHCVRENFDATKSTPQGLLRLAHNLYQLVGDDGRGVADIVSVPLPLVDPQSKTNGADRHAMSLAIGFIGTNIRLPCKSFEEKSKHASFLGCDVLLSGEWGLGMSSSKCGALTAEDRCALVAANGLRGGRNGEGVGTLEMMGSYDVAELVTMSRPRYHVAPGPTIPFQYGDAFRSRQQFISSLPYRYPATSFTSGGGSHVGRFIAMGSVMTSSEEKVLGKAFKFVHAVGIVPLSCISVNDRESTQELNLVVDCPYIANNSKGNDMNSGDVLMGGVLEAHTRYLAQEHASPGLGGGGSDGDAHQVQQRPSRKRINVDGDAPSSGISGQEKDEAMALLNAHELLNAPNYAKKFEMGEWICSSKNKYQQYICQVNKCCRKKIRTYCTCTPGMWMCGKCHVQHVLQSQS
jgi:hypothetical protein